MKNGLIMVEGKKSYSELLVTGSLPIFTAILAYLLIRGDLIWMDEKLSLPTFTLPVFVTCAISGVLYLLQGLASYRMKLKNPNAKAKAHTYFAIQLLLAFLCPIILFRFGSVTVSFFTAVLLFIFVICTFKQYNKTDKLAGRLYCPFMIWSIYLLAVHTAMFLSQY